MIPRREMYAQAFGAPVPQDDAYAAAAEEPMTAKRRGRDINALAAAVLGQGQQSATEEVRTSVAPEQAKPAQPAKSASTQVRTSARGTPTLRVKPIRMTVEHRRLRRWCQEAAEDLQVSEVAGAEVVRSLLALLHDDPELARRTMATLRQTGGSRRR